MKMLRKELDFLPLNLVPGDKEPLKQNKIPEHLLSKQCTQK